MLPMRPGCECCDRDLPADATQALRFITVLGLCSLALGGFVLLAILHPGSGLGD